MLRNQPFDPRYYQIAVLSSLLLYGLLKLDFQISWGRVVFLLSSVLAVQFICTFIFKLGRFDPRSALISGLSLCLLLRTNQALLAFLAGAIAILSKFIFRLQGKHFFNPTNFGIVAMLLFFDSAWVSSGQWGNIAFFAFLMACLGGMVVNRALRSDIAFAFLFFHCAFLFGRSLSLGEPISIPLHRMQSGALILFAFFMISDPKATPNSRSGRILFAFLVALGAWYVQFKLFRPNGLLWSLAACSLFTPLIDRLLPGDKYEWSGIRASKDPSFNPSTAG